MGKLDADPPARHRAEQGPARAQETGRHRKLAAPLMGPQAETMDRLISRTEEELGAWDFRQRQSRLANLRAAIVARHGERKA